MTATPPFDIASDDIFKILGLEDLGEAEKRDLLTTMLETIQNRVIARVMDNLNETERDQIDGFFKSNDNDSINALLVKKGIATFPELVAQESMLYKLEMANRIASDTSVTE